MTSSDQLSPMLMACVGLAGILLSFSDGLSRVGPNTVARLWRDILLMLSFSATLNTAKHFMPKLLFFYEHEESAEMKISVTVRFGDVSKRYK